ncbi:serine/threonine-protein kinase [Tuwongella immobilis]|uniref:non-specific serine/threonine protein kinase n=1 Tax=Tuwongella immobilis TaxID=692036 RepID=A0A6C2YVR2_9BACT|nr:serine/threonine-protein kinase [Tuwongella immobilis]VIP05457.1 serine threonine protein kinase : Serine/threonine protein kinase OS=Singulisphaera acidiphila (strain ATCC BAA-1392 / DSM 18658 / VKM B-2454 / MOB10) GN=Sinac_6153 PE=3 SV=1: Pkinase [Tuwongella immobilis]VTS08270.1 serine threonine protein kinase : Serine/threonine protein kinase OS=Singulisphaera acidiphila (strain ATCC BAA-1392 / DSM 18658 / VKM B-2454 / MOB10) GN=Sinac_6153 PE=3 SV=1: Pkinase [Tuwongella immobilis]
MTSLRGWQERPVAFSCPYCSHSISVKTPKPGRYTPKCPKCAGVFQLIIPADADAAWQVKPLPNAGQPTTAPAAPPTAPSGAPATSGTPTNPGTTPGIPSSKTVLPTARPNASGDAPTLLNQPGVTVPPPAPPQSHASTEATGNFEPIGDSPQADHSASKLVLGSKTVPATQKTVLPTATTSPPPAVESTGEFRPVSAPAPKPLTLPVSKPVPAPPTDATLPSAAAIPPAPPSHTLPASQAADARSDDEPADATLPPDAVPAQPSQAGTIRMGTQAGLPGKTRLPSAKTKVDVPPSDATLATDLPAADADEPQDFAVDEPPQKSPPKSPAGSSRKAKSATAAEPDDLPETLGGYRIEKELGRGGMGAVYLARQLSLDRPVALKVMNPRWAADAVFVARFIREAYAAAQLVHHNVVQIYDIGLDHDVHFFSMEFVEGQSLSQVIKREGKLDPELAVGYILQAARGLKFAHDRGMIHRDIKPDNLMLNTQGIVKVADLGLVKTPAMQAADDALGKVTPPPTGSLSASLGADITNANVAMGTPAYMSPEQCRDAAQVDHRADIYSLGCTLYVLLTGRPPFTGSTAIEVMSKHVQEAMIPPDQIVKWVPKEVSSLLLKMTAKNPADRHPSMDALIADLEQWLGVQSSGPFTPKEEHASLLEQCVNRFQDAPLAKLRSRVIPGFFGGSALVGIASLLLGYPNIALGMVGMLISAVASYFVLQGIREKTYLFRRVREMIFSSPLSDLLVGAAGGLLLLLMLYFSGLLWVWLGFGIVGVGVAFALHTTIDRPLAKQRQAALDDAEALFKRLRLQGLEEDALRQFVGKYSGKQWEEFFEAMFGFEAKLQTRAILERVGGGARQAEKHAAWREPLLQALETLHRKRREARERKILQQLEQKALLAKGVDSKTAQTQAEAAADFVVAQAGEIRQIDGLDPTVVDEANPQPTGRRVRNVSEMMRSAEKPPKKMTRPPVSPVQRITQIAMSGKLRFLVAAGLLLGCFAWIHQNLGGTDAANLLSVLDRTTPWKPLGFFGLFDHANAGVAGLWLLVSLGFASWIGRGGLMLAAAVTLIGHRLIVPAFGTVPPYLVGILLGTAIALVSMALSPPPKR